MTTNGNPAGFGHHSGRLLTGPEATIAASILEQEEQSRQSWPFNWVYPPKNSIRREPPGSIVAPAVGVQTQILAFTVPTNFRFLWSSLLLTYDGGGFVPGSGDIAWTVDLDTPIGVTILTSSPLPDYQSILFPRGSYANGPWKLAKNEWLKSGQTLRAKVTTTAAIGPGAPNYFSALFGGWLVPAVK